MAISWGPWQSHMRLGIDVIMSPASVGSSTMTVALTINMYAQMDSSSSVYGNWPVSFSGAWTGSGTVAINLGPGQSALIWTTKTSRATSTSSQALSYNASVSHALGSTSIARGFTIPARPAAPPLAPGTPTVVRNSDTSLTVSWSRNSTYTAVVVQRSTGDGKWVQVGRPTGNAYTFTDTTTVANQRYFYRVAGVNAGGQSGWSGNSASTYTTPNPPTAVSAVRDGANIVVTGTPGNAWANKYDVMDGASVIASDVTLPYTHANPSASVAHQYKLRARIGTLAGGWSAPSNVVQLTAPPAAPTGLAPNGVNVADDEPVQFVWTHNPVDSSRQSAAELRYRKVGTTAWTTLTATSASQITGPVLAADPWEWQVRTRGAHADWSPWSAVATLTSITRPGVAIVTPAETWDRPILPVEWTWEQLRGIPQSAWQAELVDDETGEVVEQLSGQNGARAAVFARRVDDGEAYRVRVRGAAGTLWSEWAEQRVEIAFVPPAMPIVDVTWSETEGVAYLSVQTAALAPFFSVTYPAHNQTVPSGPGPVVFSGGANPGARVELLSLANGALLGEGVADAAGTWRAEVNRQLLPGPYTIKAKFGAFEVNRSFTVADGVPQPPDPGNGIVPPLAVAVTVERSVADDVWELIVLDVPLEATDPEVPPSLNIVDGQCLSFGATQYRVTVYSDIGAAAVAEVTLVVESWAVWISPGPDYGAAARLFYDTKIGFEDGRERAKHQFEEREFAVPYASGRLENKIDYSGRIITGDPEVATLEQLRAIARDPSPTHLYRDPLVGRVYGLMSPLRGDHFGVGIWEVSFSIDETGK